MAESRLVGPAKFRTEIQQMMFVSGETAEPTHETTSLIEAIVQAQVVEMLTRATAIAARRGVRSINTDDLIFLIRHDRAKVSRLRTFLSWKDVRKSAKDSEEKGSGDRGDQLDDFEIAGQGGGGEGGGGGPGGGGGGGGNKSGAAGNNATAVAPIAAKNKRAKVRLPWDVSTFYSEIAPDREDEEDEEEEEMTTATLQRLKNADERTKDMTPEEYLHWSECRQASFTFRKGKRFREWAGFGIVTEAKPNDDIVDILGFLTFEIVQTLTEEALRVKRTEDVSKRVAGLLDGTNGAGGMGGSGTKRDVSGQDPVTGKRKRREPGLFDPPEEARTPVAARHIQEAFRRLQKVDVKARYMRHIPGSGRNRPLKLV